jgi:hypothetical protein
MRRPTNPLMEKLGFAPIDAAQLVIGLADGLEMRDMSADIGKCTPASGKIAVAVQKIIIDLKKETIEGVEDAIKDAAGVVEAYKESLDMCQDYSSDVQELQADLSQIAINIFKLAEHEAAFKANIIAHEAILRKDVGKIEEAFAKDDWLTIGKNAGEVLRLTVLDFSRQEEDGNGFVNPKSINLERRQSKGKQHKAAVFNVQGLIQGMAEGLEKKDMTADLAKCLPKEMKIAEAVEKVIKDLEEETEAGIEKAIQDASAVVEAYRDAISECEAYTADVQELADDLSTIAKNIVALPQHEEAFTANIILHKKKLLTDLESLKKA